MDSKDDSEYTVTYRDCYKWFDILNACVFGNKLPRFGKIRIGRQRGHNALFCYLPDTKENSLLIHHYFPSKKVFVDVLAHEMIHLFQLIYGEPMGHGKAFHMWNDNFNYYNLSLAKVY